MGAAFDVDVVTLSVDVAFALVAVALSRRLVNSVEGDAVIADVPLSCSTVVGIGVVVTKVEDESAVRLVVAPAEQRVAYNSVWPWNRTFNESIKRVHMLVATLLRTLSRINGKGGSEGSNALQKAIAVI